MVAGGYVLRVPEPTTVGSKSGGECLQATEQTQAAAHFQEQGVRWRKTDFRAVAVGKLTKKRQTSARRRGLVMAVHDVRQDAVRRCQGATGNDTGLPRRLVGLNHLVVRHQDRW